VKASKPNRPASRRRKAKPFVSKKYLLFSDSEGGLTMPDELMRELNVRVGDEYALWREGNRLVAMFPKSGNHATQIPKRAERGRIEPALPEKSPGMLPKPANKSGK